jgi:hypothetical protein
METTGIGSAAIHELKDELLHWLCRYEEKLNEAEELMYWTAAAMRQADQTLANSPCCMCMPQIMEAYTWFDQAIKLS